MHVSVVGWSIRLPLSLDETIVFNSSLLSKEHYIF